MKRTPLLAHTGLMGRLLILFGIVCICLLITGIPVLGITLIAEKTGSAGMNSPAILKLLQFLQSVAIFLIPAIVMARLVSNSSAGYLEISRKPTISQVLLTTTSMLFLAPVMGLIIEWNEGITFPAFLAPVENWMREKEDLAKEMTELLFRARSWSGWLVNLFLAGVTAAVCEEFFFRGMLQNLFRDKWKKSIGAILLSAFIFSAIHLQFYGFIPRFLLGAYFGYLLVWTGSLWIPILAHFLNNALALLQMYAVDKGIFEEGELLTGNPNTEYIMIAACTLLFFGSVWKIKQLRIRNTDTPTD